MGEKIKPSFVIRIGKKMRKVLDQQKKQIEEATYDVVEASDCEAGEILAKKLGDMYNCLQIKYLYKNKFL